MLLLQMRRNKPYTFLLFIFLLTGHAGLTQEICNNWIDDDADGLVDLHDPDCQCHFLVTDNLLRNGSFEQYDHCPINYTYTSDYQIATYWQYGSKMNETKYYHNFHCSYDSLQIMLYQPPTLPIPDGQGFVSISITTGSCLGMDILKRKIFSRQQMQIVQVIDMVVEESRAVS